MPVLEKFPGWKTDLTTIRAASELPRKATEYINFIQRHLGCPIDVISVGPDREQTLWIKPVYKD